MPTFLHAGRMGDLILGLSAVKEAGGGVLYLHSKFKASGYSPHSTPLRTIMPLLEAQPYIQAVKIWDGDISCIDYDLRDFPNRSINNGKLLNIVDCHRAVCGLLPAVGNHFESWLTVPSATKLSHKNIVIHRSKKYRNIKFPWDFYAAKFREQAVFVGLPAEYEDFVRKFGWMDYAPTSNVLKLAQVIAGATTFIGNQGVAFAIAEGLKKPTVLEACCHAPSCIFPRPRMWCYWCGDTPAIPSAYSFPKKSEYCWEY